jgi:phage gp46-like protein
MTDIALTYRPGLNGLLGSIGIGVEGGQLTTGDALASAVLLSIFTDRRARPDDQLPDVLDKRGYWADADWGSRLWLLEREKQTEQTKNRAIGYVKEALQWLIADGLAKTVEVQADWVRTGLLGLLVDITRPDRVAIRYEYTWQQVASNAV